MLLHYDGVVLYEDAFTASYGNASAVHKLDHLGSDYWHLENLGYRWALRGILVEESTDQSLEFLAVASGYRLILVLDYLVNQPR